MTRPDDGVYARLFAQMEDDERKCLVAEEEVLDDGQPLLMYSHYSPGTVVFSADLVWKEGGVDRVVCQIELPFPEVHFGKGDSITLDVPRLRSLAHTLRGLKSVSGWLQRYSVSQ